MAQAEVWLRIALGRYPNDPNILGLAARFEQARGNNERASAFWRAAIAAMPPGSSIKSLDYGLVTPPGSYRAPGPGDTRRLLDPRLDPLPTAEKLAPLPSYQRNPQRPLRSQRRAAAVCSATPMTAPSDSPLPLPSGASNPGTHPAGRELRPANPPVYVPPGASRNNAPSGPVLIEQSARQPTQLTGRVNLPPSEENVAIHQRQTSRRIASPRRPIPARKVRPSLQTCAFRRSLWTPRPPRLRSSSPLRPIASSRRAPLLSFTLCPTPPSARCPLCNRLQLQPGRLQRGAIHAFRSGGGHRRLFRSQTASLPAATVPAAARCHVGKAPGRLNRNQAQAEEEEPAGHADPRQRTHHEQ